MQIEEHDGALVFLHRVEAGAADRSYGIEVARLAGMPERILLRANQLLQQLDAHKIETPSSVFNGSAETSSILAEPLQNVDPEAADPAQEAFLNKIRTLDINQLSPMEAFLELDALIREAKEMEES